MKDNIVILCDLGVGGERGRVFSPEGVVGALSATDYKDPPKCCVADMKIKTAGTMVICEASDECDTDREHSTRDRLG